MRWVCSLSGSGCKDKATHPFFDIGSHYMIFSIF
jgi:hypothetical protein